MTSCVLEKGMMMLFFAVRVSFTLWVNDRKEERLKQINTWIIGIWITRKGLKLNQTDGQDRVWRGGEWDWKERNPLHDAKCKKLCLSCLSFCSSSSSSSERKRDEKSRRNEKSRREEQKHKTITKRTQQKSGVELSECWKEHPETIERLLLSFLLSWQRKSLQHDSFSSMNETWGKEKKTGRKKTRSLHHDKSVLERLFFSLHN